MFSTLRSRLFASYLLLMVTMLSIMAAAIIFILNTRPAPLQPAFDRLYALALSLPLTEIYEQSTRGVLGGQRRLDNLRGALQSLSDQRSVRLLIVSNFSRTIAYDSAGTFPDGTPLDGHVENYIVPPNITRPFTMSFNTVRGDFMDRPTVPGAPRAEWIFVGVEAINLRGVDYVLLLADRKPSQSLQAALTEFGTELLPVFLQAAAVGSLIAIVLAALIARGIVRPLQQVALAATRAATHLKAGSLQPLAMSGPDEVRALSAAFNGMMAEVSAEQQSQHDFMVNVSHDLKTPLTSIQGYSQAIIDGAAPDSIKAAQVIHDEAARLNRMVVELTDLARLQAGRLSMHMTPIDLGALATAIAQRLTIVAHEKDIALSIDAPSMPPIAGDGDRLVQVFTNLISNAIKYTPVGGSVWVRAQQREGGIEVMVQDNGIGIAEEELPRIFERFYQVDKARGPRRGTGLGLAIVREIVQAHGGRIQVNSAGRGRGSSFVVWLPGVGVFSPLTAASR